MRDPSRLLRVETERAIASNLLQVEYTKAPRTICKRGRLTAKAARLVTDHIQWVPIELDPQPPLHSTAPSLALRFDLATYDATYLELALREQLPIATQEEALAGAARAAGVGVEKA